MSAGASWARAAAASLAALLLLGSPRARAQEPPGAAKLKELGITLLLVRGGEFPMGSEEGDDEERPVHPVKVRDFFLAATEVTQAQWQAVMGANPSRFKGCDTCPVESVSWNDVQKFVAKLGELAGAKYRPPTEAEWEYAAGGGPSGRTRWAGTSDEAALPEYAWFEANGEGKTHPVATRKPNVLGFSDMSGNVWEWCADWHDEGWYAKSPAENPTGPARGFARILRGGSWINSANGVRIANRHRVDPGFASINLNGFRIAADAP